MGQMDQIGSNVWPKLGQTGPKQPILKVETQDFGLSTFLKIITTFNAYIKIFELTAVIEWVKWTKSGQMFGQNWPKNPNWI